MPTREEMIAHIQSASSAQAPRSREEMVSFIQSQIQNGQQQKPQEKDGALTAGVRNFVQGATGNFSDEIAGVVEAAGAAAGLKGAGSGPINEISKSEDGPTLDWAILKDAYKRARDKEREALKKDTKDRPGLSTATNLAGAVASPINKLAKGASLLRGGAILGGIQGAGGSEADSLGGLALDTTVGGVAGAAVGKVIDEAAPLLKGVGQKIADKSKSGAELLSARAQGLERGTARKLGASEVRAIGRQGLDKRLLKLGDTADDMIAKNQGIKKAAMDSRAKAYGAIDEVGASEFNPATLVNKIQDKMLAGKNLKYADTQELVSAMQPHIENILSRGNNNITMKEAQALVESVSKKAKFDTSRSSLQNDVAKEIYGVVRNYINDSADEAANKIGAPGLKKAITEANKTYATAKSADKLLANKQARETGNRIFGLTDVITGSAAGAYGLGSGDWTTAAGVVGGKRILEKYGAKATAMALDSVAKKLSVPTTTVQRLAEKDPRVVSAIVKAIEERLPSAPKAAEKRPSNDGDTSIAKLRGEDKWVNDGLKKVSSIDPYIGSPEFASFAMSNPRARMILAELSGLKSTPETMALAIDKLKKIKGAN